MCNIETWQDICFGCRCVISWCDLRMTSDLAVVTLTFKILLKLFLRNCEGQKVDTM